jgi:NAD(P)-dependent dehydrogenase (short-subunit alcohol dehydrogenase family)
MGQVRRIGRNREEVTPVKRLEGRKIVVAGAASGIGKATAELFAAEGAALCLIDRDAVGLETVARQCSAHAFVADVTDEGAIQRAVSEGAEKMAGIDGVVYSAGIALRASVTEMSLAQWRQVLDVNLTGAFILVKACLPWLQQSGQGTIVSVGSAQSLLPNAPKRTAYAASKGGILNFTRALAADLAPSIRANTVCPGLIETPLVAGVPANLDNYAMRRTGTPEEVARSILFLTSAESSFVTGAALAVDGGRTFH